MALSTRGRGAHSAPSGVTTSFRPPRFRNVSGMWTVIVSPSAETVARVTLRPPAAGHFPHQPGEPVRPQPNLDAVHPHVHPLDQQLHDPRLLGREQFVPQRVELQQRLPRLVLGDVVLLGPRRAPILESSKGPGRKSCICDLTSLPPLKAGDGQGRGGVCCVCIPPRLGPSLTRDPKTFTFTFTFLYLYLAAQPMKEPLGTAIAWARADRGFPAEPLTFGHQQAGEQRDGDFLWNA